ncbi:hypothetical protein [Candidatus Clavichlamydia salmonicola]|uniref:hypothetical protein n=1 Tax=Candidatus Clavichlamydia salmonicola TaxID=469812 RepID=UPI0018913B0E|nr:hypothetical protein [Candidatus Clavichlamydia salmonicola]
MLTRFFLSYAGITFDPETGTKIALLHKTCKGWVLESLLASETQQNLSRYIPSSAIRIASLSPEKICIRFSETDVKKNKHIQASFSLRADSLLPFPKEEAISQLIISPSFEGKKTVTSFVTRKNFSHKLINELARQNLFPDRISGKQVDYLNLINYISHPIKEPYIVLFADQKNITCMFFSHNILKATRNFLFDSKASSKIKMFLESVATLSPSAYIENILSVGLSNEEILSFKNLLKISVTSLIFKGLPPISSKQWKEFGPAIAAALAGANSKFNLIDFSTNKTAHPKFKARIKQILFPTLGLAACLSLLSIGAYKLSILPLQREARRTFSSLCNLCDQPNFPMPSSQKSLKSGSTMLIKSLHFTPPNFPLIPIMASPANVLKFVSEKLDLHENKEGPSLSSFSYKMDSYPSKNYPLKKYSVKISIEGFCPDHLLMNRLKLALTSNSSIANLEQPITWKTDKGFFYADFYLKDGTPY